MKNSAKVCALLLLCCNLPAWAASKIYTLLSPDKDIKVEITTGEKELSYSIFHKDELIMKDSKIGLTGNEDVFSAEKASKKESKIDREVVSPFYRFPSFQETANVMELKFKSKWSVEFRAYDDGVAYRLKTSEKDELIIKVKKGDYKVYKDKIEYLNVKKNIIIKNKIANKFNYSFNTPIIFINSLYPGTDDMEVLFKLYQRLSSMGFAISGISDCPVTKLLSFHKYKEFGFVKYSKETVLKLNHFIKYIEENELPDIIIIHSSVPIASYSDNCPFDYGLNSFVISRAVMPDYSICCAPNQCCQEEFWIAFNNRLQYLLNYNIDCVHISNLVVNIQDHRIEEFNNFLYYQIDDNLYNYNNFDSSNEIKISYMLNDKNMDKIINDITKRFSKSNMYIL